MLTDALLRSAVGQQFGEETAANVSVASAVVETLPSTGGGSFRTTVQRLSSSPGAGEWSVVVKQLTADPDRPGWDREANVYADEAWLTAALPEAMKAPRLLVSERTEEGVTLVLEDLPATGTLAVDERAAAARLLSEFNGSTAAVCPWWSSDFLATEHRTLSDHPERLTEARSNPRHERIRQQLVELSNQAPELLDLLESVPHGPAHLDAYSRNLLVDRTTGTIGLVDWANAGSAPRGTDPATLFVLTLDYLDSDASQISEIESTIVEAMHAGLLDAGAGSTINQATHGFHAAARLRHLAMMMNALPMVERQDPAVSAIVGKPLDEIVEQWIAVGDHLLNR